VPEPQTSHPSVTFCITELDVGGAEKALVRIAIGLKQRDWNVRVISLRDRGAMSKPLEEAGIPVIALNGGSFADIRILRRLRKELKKHSTDVLMCFLHQANIYGRLAARYSGGPAVVSGIRVADRRKWVTLTDRFTQRWTDHYIAVSQHVAETHATLCRISPDRISAIRNGVDCPPKDKVPSVKQRPDAALLFVGRLTPQKNPSSLLKAITLLPPALRTKVTLTFAGDGPLRASLLQRVKELQLESSVHLPGHSSDVVTLMQRSTLLVLPSRWEGLPNVVLEAMANGLPVIASDVDGVREVVADNETGWLIPATQPQALAATIQHALESPESRQRISNASQTLVNQELTWDRASAEYDRVLRKFLHQN